MPRYVCPACDNMIHKHHELEEDEEIMCNECGTTFFWDGEELIETESAGDFGEDNFIGEEDEV